MSSVFVWQCRQVLDVTTVIIYIQTLNQADPHKAAVLLLHLSQALPSCSVSGPVRGQGARVGFVSAVMRPLIGGGGAGSQQSLVRVLGALCFLVSPMNSFNDGAEQESWFTGSLGTEPQSPVVLHVSLFIPFSFGRLTETNDSASEMSSSPAIAQTGLFLLP
ncbi:hypothetical protein WMY93_005854 [Mugilogobius chulae]|uniref:Uncharacterized protein n=1 Tax=Mugilogobius chulae TaxID=88201 RepID=A0AAW0PL84_9GOBI